MQQLHSAGWLADTDREIFFICTVWFGAITLLLLCCSTLVSLIKRKLISFLDILALENDPRIHCMLHCNGIIWWRSLSCIDKALARYWIGTFEGDIWVSAIDTQNVGRESCRPTISSCLDFHLGTEFRHLASDSRTPQEIQESLRKAQKLNNNCDLYE